MSEIELGVMLHAYTRNWSKSRHSHAYHEHFPLLFYLSILMRYISQKTFLKNYFLWKRPGREKKCTLVEHNYYTNSPMKCLLEHLTEICLPDLVSILAKRGSRTNNAQGNIMANKIFNIYVSGIGTYSITKQEFLLIF